MQLRNNHSVIHLTQVIRKGMQTCFQFLSKFNNEGTTPNHCCERLNPKALNNEVHDRLQGRRKGLTVGVIQQRSLRSAGIYKSFLILLRVKWTFPYSVEVKEEMIEVHEEPSLNL